MNPSSGRVPLHKVTDLRERGLDVLGGAAANGAVRLDNGGPRGGGRHCVGQREQRLRYLLVYRRRSAEFMAGRQL
jgi:hypothetical protein